MPAAGGEFELIRHIRGEAGRHRRVPLGIGDDCAVVATAARTLVASDMLLEGRHFTIPSATPRQIGRKALAVNLSDLAAMAAKPLAALVSVAHRRDLGMSFAKELHAGLREMAEEYGVSVAGGDTNVWDGPLVVNVTLLGEATASGPVRRGGARAGDRIFVTGALGGSLQSGRHATFVPRVELALQLHAQFDLHAMIDISDGLLRDLGHICEESGAGAEIAAEAIPIHPDVAVGEPQDRLRAALTDGEDFELLFCVDPAEAPRLAEASWNELPPREIGTIVGGGGVTVSRADGSAIDFATPGWEHTW